MENRIEHKKERVFYLDFLRAISTMAVILMHIEIEKNWRGISIVQFNTIRCMLADWCVPMFLMITGTLFLNASNCSFQRIWSHVKKTILVIVFWGFLYNFVSLTIIEGFSISTIINSLKMIVLADVTFCYQFWYLYALIPMYFLLPIFNAFIKSATKKDFLIVVFLFFVFSIVVPNIIKYTGDFGATALINKFSLFCSLYFYMLLGAYLSRINVKKTIVFIFGAFSVMIFGIVIVCGVLNIDIYPDKIYGYDSIYICIVASSIYLIAKMKNDYSKNTKKIFEFISNYSFGIYILHVIIIQMLRKIVHLDSGFAPAFISVPIVLLVVFLISLASSVIAKKIPVLKRLL